MQILKVGCIAKYAEHSSHIQRLRSYTMQGGKPSQISAAKDELTKALAMRFEIVSLYHNGFCNAAKYKVVGSNVEGCCIASTLDPA